MANKESYHNPYFIGIGPHKTGTSWLYKVLQAHPDMSMPPIKEVSYFYIKEVLGEGIGWRTYLRGEHLLCKRYRSLMKDAIEEVKQDVRKGRWNSKRVYWYLRYFTFRHSDNWYVKLFDGEQKMGDISPMYSYLSEESIATISRLIPHVKIIIGLRNPIERTWSSCRMNFLKFQQLSVEDLLENQELLSPMIEGKQWLANDYVSLVSRWKSFFPENQLFIYCYDELEQNAAALFDRICQFLEIETIPNRHVNRKINAGIETKMPDGLAELFWKKNKDFMQKMPIYFDSPYPQNWLEKYQ